MLDKAAHSDTKRGNPIIIPDPYMPEPASCPGARVFRGVFVLLGAAWVSLPLAELHAEPKARKPAPEAAEIPGALKEAENAILALREPVSILSSDAYRDGGTVSFTITDASATKLAACMDGRLSSATRTSLYLDASHPSQEGALRLPTGGAAESALLAVLKKLVSDNAQNSERLSSVVAAVENRRAAAAKSAAKGLLKGDEAIQIVLAAFKPLVGNYKKVETRDTDDAIELIFFDGPERDALPDKAGVGTKFRVKKETREILNIDRHEPGKGDSEVPSPDGGAGFQRSQPAMRTFAFGFRLQKTK